MQIGSYGRNRYAENKNVPTSRHGPNTAAHSTVDIHPTLTQHNTLAVNVQFLTIRNAALSAAARALTTRIEALEAQRLTTTLDPGLAALDVDQTTFESSNFGKQYFAASKTLHVFTGSSPTNTPY